MKSEEIEERDTIKDLGVWMDSRVSFSGHIVKVCFSANRLVGLFRRTYVHITAENFKIFYKVFIRPKLEYACHIWSPYLVKDMLKLEKVQRRATKCVKSLAKLPYRERMRALGLICLENRRKRAELNFNVEFYQW